MHLRGRPQELTNFHHRQVDSTLLQSLGAELAPEHQNAVYLGQVAQGGQLQGTWLNDDACCPLRALFARRKVSR